ncbi:L,D-transpeptidase [Bosea sp. (in: a-proteobacteria)]|uniref:L,D-transpeptidase n=1 Tax=Bosea sp. (in: a-proteobacteria) TaxID=1871050 RepID=UPI0025BEE34B|nr:L,D-transpeptidase [Bosea sp. (in: a-proteobacteria)]
MSSRLDASPLARPTRRVFAAMTPLFLAACVSQRQQPFEVPNPNVHYVSPEYLEMYGDKPNEKYPLPATDISEVDPRFLRQIVSYPTAEHPGTIVVDTDNHFLYLVQAGGKAVRYGIGVGKQGMSWRGRARVARKAEWPRWTPTPDMIRREPKKNGPWAGGMKGGLDNPLGARALYLYQGDRDTLYRIHGTSEPWSIGKSMSSGCIRLFNQDIIDLYSRVPAGTNVLVLNRGRLAAPETSDEAPPPDDAFLPPEGDF